MRREATWDTFDEFAKISEILFSESVLTRAGIDGRPIPLDHGKQVLTEYRIFAAGEQGYTRFRLLGSPSHLDSARAETDHPSYVFL